MAVGFPFVFLSPAFSAGMALSMSLIMAIGPQNAHVLRMGLQRQHLWLTVAVSILADVVLIGFGVLGLAQLGGLSDKVHGALVGAGVLFLTVYGWRAFQRFLHPATGDAVDGSALPQGMNRRQAVWVALGFSWLNPQAWLDTAVLIGSASLAYGSANTVFGLGAITGSVVWFCGLALLMLVLGRRINAASVWRWIDALVALLMWGTAVWLIRSLF